MWPLGHVAVAYLCYTIATRARFDAPPAHVPALLLAFGSQFPDLVDKPLAWYLTVLPTGRSLAHSLLLLVPLSIAVSLVAARYDRTECGIAFGIGAISHTLVDVLPMVWDAETRPNQLLWPITPVEPYEGGPPTVLGLLRDSLTEPYFLAQWVLAAVAFTYWRRHGYPGLRPIRTALERVGPTPG
ncbi:metal-dependent hydrolase [Haloterrigena salinisoli]|uniref:metal-dependent hydrolase n=1 Tax=Haloterrigena salinisoli TaxID=3132747 RepID=UPI0030CE142A